MFPYDNAATGLGHWPAPQSGPIDPDMHSAQRSVRRQQQFVGVLEGVNKWIHPLTYLVRRRFLGGPLGSFGSGSPPIAPSCNGAIQSFGQPPWRVAFGPGFGPRPGELAWRGGHPPTREELVAYVRTRDPGFDAAGCQSDADYARRVDRRVGTLMLQWQRQEPRLRGEPPRPWEAGYLPNDIELEAHVLSVTIPRRGQRAVDDFESLHADQQRDLVAAEIGYLRTACNAGLPRANGFGRAAAMTRPAPRAAVGRDDARRRQSGPPPFPWQQGRSPNRAELRAYVRARGLDAQERQMLHELPDDAGDDLVAGKVAALVDEQAGRAPRPAGAPPRPWDPGYLPSDEELRAYVDTVVMPGLGEPVQRELDAAGGSARARRATAEFNRLQRARATSSSMPYGRAPALASTVGPGDATARFQAEMQASMAAIQRRLYRSVQAASGE